MNDGRSFNGIEADRKTADSIRWPKDDVLCQRLDRIVDCVENGSDGPKDPTNVDPDVEGPETNAEEEKMEENVEEKMNEIEMTEAGGSLAKVESEKDENESQPTNVETDDDAASKKR